MIFLLRGLLMITISIQFITTEETHSTIEFQLNSTDNPFNVRELEKNDSNMMCLTQPQLTLVEDTVVRVLLSEIKNENLQLVLDFLETMNPDKTQLMERIIKESWKGRTGCFDDDYLTLLKFVNQSSNRNGKLAGYRTLFNEIAFNLTLTKSISPFLNLHHYISQDESINSDADFGNLLNNIESPIDYFIQSSEDLFSSSNRYEFGYDYRRRDSYGFRYMCIQPSPNFSYVVKRICSTYPDKIEKLWDHLAGEFSLELLFQFISELERNNRMNYTVLAISNIKSELSTPIFDELKFKQMCDLRHQLLGKIQMLPNNGPLRKLLTQDQFYIKNAYDQQYLHITGQSYSQWSTDHERYFTNSGRNLTWTIDFRLGHYPRDAVEIVNDGRLIGAKQCETHGDWYPTDFLYEPSGAGGTWTFKITKNDELRIQHVGSGDYLAVGDKGVVRIASLNENEISKFEWILESDNIEEYFGKEYECKSQW